MKKTIYQGVKVALGTALAIYIAELFGLAYATTAGIIGLLSIMGTRAETYLIGFKRFVGSAVAILLAAFVFGLLGHHLVAFAIFMVLFVMVSIGLNLQASISVGTVLVTHIFTLQTLNFQVVSNEVALLMIGVLTGFVFNLHMPNVKKELEDHKVETELLIKRILNKMADQLLNKCQIEEPRNLLSRLDETLKEGLALAITYEENNPLKAVSYDPAYFRMRREQYFLLKAMERHFDRLFITAVEAAKLSDFTGHLAQVLNEANDGEALLKDLGVLREYYKNRPLPTDRESFENRATLYQYMNDLEHFVRFKSTFMATYGHQKIIG